MTELDVSFIYVGPDLLAQGFRKVAAVARAIHPTTEVVFINSHYEYFSLKFWQKTKNNSAYLEPSDLSLIADHFRNQRLLCFSSMTPYEHQTRQIIDAVREKNPDVFIVWGGSHPILSPEDAIHHVNAICTGEGETAYRLFFERFRDGEDFCATPNFWFRKGKEVIRNTFLPLQSNLDLSSLPHPLYANNEIIFQTRRGFQPVSLGHYLDNNQLSYSTLWSLGCPYKCAYCGNNKMIDNDPAYRIIRHLSVNHIIEEVKGVLVRHPHIQSIVFLDDSLIAIKLDVLAEFAKRWRAEIGLPFFVFGVIPAFVEREKIALLVQAGLNRLRMGIQSGSDLILAFYNRPSNAKRIKRACDIISEFSPNMIPPAYDIILDNPIETRQDILDTVQLLYDLPRPYNIYPFSLSAIPNTELHKKLKAIDENLFGIENKDYFSVTPTMGNILIVMMSIFRPPLWLKTFMCARIKPLAEAPTLYPILFNLVLILKIIKHTFYRVWHMDVPERCGRLGWWLWRLGVFRLRGFWKRSHSQ